jgi:hypothetical protein
MQAQELVEVVQENADAQQDIMQRVLDARCRCIAVS